MEAPTVWSPAMRAQGPQEVLVPEPVQQVAAGDAHTLCLTAGGSIWAFGCNKHGQLGLGSSDATSDRPRLVRALHGGCLPQGSFWGAPLAATGTASRACVSSWLQQLPVRRIHRWLGAVLQWAWWRTEAGRLQGSA